MVPIAANVPNLETSALGARKKAGRNKLSEVSNKGVSNIRNGHNTVELGHKTNEGMSQNLALVSVLPNVILCQITLTRVIGIFRHSKIIASWFAPNSRDPGLF